MSGIEPESKAILNLSHSQVYLVYCHKPEKVVGLPNSAFRPDALHQNWSDCFNNFSLNATRLYDLSFRSGHRNNFGNHFDFLFSQESTCYLKLDSRFWATPWTTLLERDVQSVSCYWQLYFFWTVKVVSNLLALFLLFYPVETLTPPLNTFNII